jgi:hypothetical protein
VNEALTQNTAEHYQDDYSQNERRQGSPDGHYRFG